MGRRFTCWGGLVVIKGFCGERAGVSAEVDKTSDDLEEPVQGDDTASMVLERRYREIDGEVSPEGMAYPPSCLTLEMDEDWKDVEDGIWMRCGVGVANEDRFESASTETPVELGDSGEAIMGAGIVWRLR